MRLKSLIHLAFTLLFILGGVMAEDKKQAVPVAFESKFVMPITNPEPMKISKSPIKVHCQSFLFIGFKRKRDPSAV